LGVKRTWRLRRGMSANDAVDGARSAASKCYRLVASKPERLKEVRPGNDDGVVKFWRNWRGHDDVMQTRSIRGSGEPVWVIALLNCALTIGTRSAQSIMASGFTAAQTGRTHDRTRPMLQQRQKVLANAAPSTHDPKRTSAGQWGTRYGPTFINWSGSSLVISILPKVSKAVWCHLGVANRVLDVLVPEISLQRPDIVALVSQQIAAGMPKHVRMDRKR
jgi:hypothetical protein